MIQTALLPAIVLNGILKLINIKKHVLVIQRLAMLVVYLYTLFKSCHSDLNNPDFEKRTDAGSCKLCIAPQYYMILPYNRNEISLKNL